jgi:hypothetical protein
MRRSSWFWFSLACSTFVLGACASSHPSGPGEDAGAADAASIDAATLDAPALDAGPPDAIPCVPSPDGEVCNGNDDDCDGTTDENFVGVGIACDVGVGECVNSGVTVCTADGTGTECGAQPLTPGAELCGTGLDEDCDELVDEGFPDLNTGCSAGAGECFATGINVCSASGLSTQCNAVPGDSHAETCDGDDEDCDGFIDEDFQINQACDGAADTDLCSEGVWACNGSGGRVCTDNTASTFDLCGGGDEDCDPTSGDGSEDGEVGQGCDGSDGDRCVEGVKLCTQGNLVCTDNTGTTYDLCGGGNEDCDDTTADGSADPQVNQTCDGADTDQCREGVRVCTTGNLVCSDNTGSTVDLCGNGDEDCDPNSGDGSGDPQVGQPCDGTQDTERCEEGLRVCTSGQLSCTDSTGSTIDTCNGADDDCDGTSNDGTEDPQYDQPCDGGDTDHCNEGLRGCVNGSLSCNDNTGSTVDLCNGLDDDCDVTTGDGAGDPQLNTTCDGADGDSCGEGTRGCTSGNLVCSDNTGTTTELCNGDQVDENCNGQTDEGWIVDDAPACSAPYNIGTMSGDSGNPTLSDSWYNDEFDVFRLTENDNGIVYLSAHIDLYSPPGVDYDLYVYCVSCSAVMGSSTAGGWGGHHDTFDVRNDDDWGSTDDFNILVEVRYYSSNRCANWTLTVTGNTAASSNNCDP